MVIPTFVNNGALMEAICQKIDELQIDNDNFCVPKSSVEQFIERYDTPKSSWTGNVRMDNIMHQANNLKTFSMNLFQRQCLKEILQCMSPLIFGNPSADELALYLKKHNMSPPETSFVYAQTSRRAGKTYIMTLSAALILANVNHFTGLFFSLYEPTCILACNMVYNWLVNEMGIDKSYVHKTVLEIQVRGPESGDIRTLVFKSGQNPDVRIIFFIFFYFICIYYVK